MLGSLFIVIEPSPWFAEFQAMLPYVASGHTWQDSQLVWLAWIVALLCSGLVPVLKVLTKVPWQPLHSVAAAVTELVAR
jgi:hypothetical protein